jgi:hypothetical protein
MNHTQQRSVNWAALLLSVLALLQLFGAVAGCGGANAPDIRSRSFTFDFNNGNEGWNADFADLPSNYNQATYELGVSHAELPSPVPVVRRGIRIQGHNRSDDLFMFLKRKVTGLLPLRTYRVTYTVEFLSNAPESSFGIGGGPGSAVIVKAGATNFEPKATVDSRDGYLRLNADKGNQSAGGANLKVLGSIGIPGDQAVYTFKTLNGVTAPVTVTADSAGSVWLVLGTDSGYEGLTALYYTAMTASFELL